MPTDLPAATASPVTTAAPRRRVAIVMIARHASGAEHQTLALARALQEWCDVAIFTGDEFAAVVSSDDALRAYVAPVTMFPLGPAFPAAPATTLSGMVARAMAYPRLQWRLRAALRSFRPDVTHLVLSPSFFAYAPWFVVGNRSKRRRAPSVVTLAGEARYALHYYGMAKRLAVRWAARRATAVVACSADEASNLRTLSARDADRATVIDNFTDVDRFRPGPRRERLVVFAARLHPEKGAIVFLEAMAIVHREAPDVRIALFGRGEEEAAVAAAIRRLGLVDVVERGFAVDMAPIFARTAIFVSCQRHENLGSSSLLEAMASGAAVVATDVGSTRQIVDSTVGACVAPTPEGIARGVLDLVNDETRRDACGAAARRRILDGYSARPYLARLLPLYEAAIVAARGRTPSGGFSA